MTGTRELIEQFGERFARFSFNQKVLLGALAAATVISLVIFSVWLQSEEYAVLFSGLTPQDASLALTELEKQGVTTDLANGGSTIMVPADQMHRMRIDLMGKGIPSSGIVGFEIFDGKQYGLTEFLQNVNFKRALEGELTKTIESLSGIQSARVHLVIPKPSIFKKSKNQPTASVVLELAREMRLDESQINGIQSLVSGSVEGLVGPEVRVHDQNGKLLSAASQDDEIGRSENQLALKREVEAYLGGKAEDMLAEILGAERVIVRIDASLNFQKVDRETETFDNRNPTVRSEESSVATDTQAGIESEDIVTNYEINRTVERLVGPVGGIERLSVSVSVDGCYELPEGEAEPVYTPLNEDELTQIERVVITAVGLDLTRGDRIEVVNLQFQSGRPMTLPQGGLNIEGILGLIPQHLGQMVLFLVAAGMILTLKKNVGRLLGQGSIVSGQRSAVVDREVEQEEAETAQRKKLKLKMTDEMVEDVREYSMEHPEKMAEMLQTWISQESGS